VSMIACSVDSGLATTAVSCPAGCSSAVAFLDSDCARLCRLRLPGR
jgi:hypothetical protein